MQRPMAQFVDHDFNESLIQFPIYCEQKFDNPNMRGLHSHHGFEFHFSFSSNGVMLVEDQEYAVLPGKVFIIKPLVYHSVQPIQESVYKRTVLSIEEDYLKNLLQADSEFASLFQTWFPGSDAVSLELTLESRDLFVIQSLLEQIEQWLNERREGYKVYVKTLLIQVLILLGRTKASSVNKARASEEMQAISERMMLYITEHCCESLDMTSLAERFHISKSYMFKIFKMFTGYTPYQYLMLQRIGLSKRMLTHGRQSVTQIAARTGFNDSSHFIRTFKEATGMTPGEFKSGPMRITS